MFLQYAIWGAWLPILFPFLLSHRHFSEQQIGWMFAVGAIGATTTGGAFVHATSGDFGLDTVYDDFIGKMEKRELTSTMERRYEERFQIPLLLALLLVALEPLIGDRRRTAGKRRLASWRKAA
jgi:hypothetical protein